MLGPGWFITMNTILVVIILTGGFFMFRAFLRRMAPDKNQNSNENQG